MLCTKKRDKEVVHVKGDKPIIMQIVWDKTVINYNYIIVVWILRTYRREHTRSINTEKIPSILFQQGVLAGMIALDFLQELRNKLIEWSKSISSNRHEGCGVFRRALSPLVSFKLTEFIFWAVVLP